MSSAWSTTARAIRSRHPELILLASYPSDAILRNLSDEVDYVCPHLYAPCSPAVEDEVRGLIDAIQRTAANKGLKLGVTEWNHTAGHWGWGALLAADAVQRAQRGPHVQPVPAPRQLRADRQSLQPGQQLLQRIDPDLPVGHLLHPLLLHADCLCESRRATRRCASKPTPDETLDVAATRRSADGQIALFAVNVGAGSQRRTIDFAPAAYSGHAQVWSLAGPSLDAVNSFADQIGWLPARDEFAFDGRCLQLRIPALLRHDPAGVTCTPAVQCAPGGTTTSWIPTSTPTACLRPCCMISTTCASNRCPSRLPPITETWSCAIKSCGICATDYKAIKGIRRNVTFPFIPGHEPSGVVAEVGPGVTHFKPGDEVIVMPSGYCGYCAQLPGGQHALLRARLHHRRRRPRARVARRLRRVHAHQGKQRASASRPTCRSTRRP